jgi:hypothetical protein
MNIGAEASPQLTWATVALPFSNFAVGVIVTSMA